MKNEDFDSSLSLYMSKVIDYFNSTNPTGFASLIVSVVWVVCGLSVLLGYSAVNAIHIMIAFYLIARVVGHFDESSEEQLRIGKYGDIKEHNPSEEYVCTNCSENKTSGDLKISYNVYYLLDYEVARTERSRNMRCNSCIEKEISSESMEMELEKD